MMKKSISLGFFAIVAVALSVYFFFNNSKAKQNELVLYGNVDIREVDLGFRVSGKIDKVFYDEGDKIKEGDLLATLDDKPYQDHVLKAKAKAQSIKTSYINAKKQFERREIARPSFAVSEEDYENSQATQQELKSSFAAAKADLAIAITQYEDTKLKAPSSGVILTRIREPGTVLSVGEPVFTVSLDTPIWIRSYVSEPYLGAIHPGMHAEIYTDTKSNPIYKGHIGFISPVAEFTPKSVETPDLRTDLVYRLRIIVDNADEGLRQGMPVTVKLLKEKPIERNSNP
jgi:HlyD family secretion protein